MDGNLCFRTPKGLKFYNCNREEVQSLIDRTQKLRSERVVKGNYRLIVTIEDIGEIEATDIWIAIGASNG